MNKTAVEWLCEKLIKYDTSNWSVKQKIMIHAKEMEKQQIMSAFDKGLITENVYYGYDDKKAEQYYNETFKK